MGPKNKNQDNENWDDVSDDFGIPWKDYSPGDSQVGEYIGSREVTPRDGSMFLSHQLKKDDDTVVGISGATLNHRFSTIRTGSRVKVTFTGTEKSSYGSTNMKMFEVQVKAGTTLLNPAHA